MSSKVVSTKLSIEEHEKFLQICKQNDNTPSALIKKLILDHISSKNPQKQINDSKTIESVQVKTETTNELAKTPEDKIAFEIIKRVEEDDITY